MAVGDAAELPIGVACGFLVAVEQKRLWTPTARTTAHSWILAAGDIAREIFKGAVGCGHRTVILLDASLHLGKQGVLQCERVAQHLRGKGVFRLQVGTDLRCQQRRVAHDLLPVVGAQPGIFVDQLDAVLDAEDRPALGGWRRETCERSIETVHGAPVGRAQLASWGGRFRRRIRPEAGTIGRTGSGLGRLEFERGAVDAVAQASGLGGAVREDVSEVGLATSAAHLRPRHQVGTIFVFADDLAVGWLVKARPTRPRIELGLGGEQRLATAHAGKFALVAFPG